MTRFSNVAAIASLAALIQGCSTTGMTNLINSKGTPDETQIRTTQSLSMPPDLQLPAPATTVAEEDGQLTSTSVAGAATVPPSDNTVSATAEASQPVAPQTQAAAVARPTPADDIYTRYGISKTNPDGTAKSQATLNTELWAAQKAEKQRANPNYGTIYNIGDLFKDG